MPGVSLALLPKRVFDFGNLRVGITQTMRLVDRIDISQYVDGIIDLRVHATTITGGTIQFELFGDGHTDEDPGAIFLTTSPLFSAPAISAVGLKTYRA
jgi:hypothetical protein